MSNVLMFIYALCVFSVTIFFAILFYGWFIWIPTCSVVSFLSFRDGEWKYFIRSIIILIFTIFVVIGHLIVIDTYEQKQEVDDQYVEFVGVQSNGRGSYSTLNFINEDGVIVERELDSNDRVYFNQDELKVVRNYMDTDHKEYVEMIFCTWLKHEDRYDIYLTQDREEVVIDY